MTKYGNTLKMMGVSGKDALFFDDALSTYHLTISPKVKQTLLNTMLNTVIMDKTVKQWFLFYEKQLPEKSICSPEVLEVIPKFVFSTEQIDAGNIKKLLNLVVQEYYRKEKFVC